MSDLVIHETGLINVEVTNPSPLKHLLESISLMMRLGRFPSVGQRKRGLKVFSTDSIFYSGSATLLRSVSYFMRFDTCISRSSRFDRERCLVTVQ